MAGCATTAPPWPPCGAAPPCQVLPAKPALLCTFAPCDAHYTPCDATTHVPPPPYPSFVTAAIACFVGAPTIPAAPSRFARLHAPYATVQLQAGGSACPASCRSKTRGGAGYVPHHPPCAMRGFTACAGLHVLFHKGPSERDTRGGDMQGAGEQGQGKGRGMWAAGGPGEAPRSNIGQAGSTTSKRQEGRERERAGRS